jgi:hypothetical protein
MFKTKDEQDDHDWLEVIAGREPSKDADPIIIRQAKLVRQAIRNNKMRNIVKNYIGDTDGTDNLGDC